MDYVPLRVRSNYSLLTGAASLDRLIAKAVQWQLPTLALTDENNLYGAVPFVKKCREAGIRPIIGSLLTTEQYQTVLLVKNRDGYANLCEIISQRQLDDHFDLSSSLIKHQAGLIVLTPSVELAASMFGKLDPSHLWLELLRPTRDRRQEECLLRTATEYGLGLVASSDTYLSSPDELEQLAMLTAIRQNRLLADVQTAVAEKRFNYLRPQQQFAALFPDHPNAISASVRIAEQCCFDLLDRQPTFPRLPGDVPQQLHEKVEAGAVRRYGRITPALSQRLHHELELIIRLGFADYFLVVADIVDHARTLGTPIAGRGSGASSVAAYSLGITNVDPIAYNLPFERFLNEGRQDFPDLDVDICWRLRDQVIDYVYHKYGDTHVAMLATYATLQPRYGFRVVAKALGLSRETITETLQLLPHLPTGKQLIESDSALPESWNRLPANPKVVREALRFARQLDGFPHHLSVHPGGVVITPDRISRHAPLQRASKGIVIAQFDKNAAEEMGLIKLDLLGNRALSAVAEAMRLVRERHQIAIDPERFPKMDEPTAALLGAAQTVGVNQLESPAMRHLISQLQPKSAKNLMQALGLIRPGAASLGMKRAFVRRARGIDPVPPIDPRLDGILRETYGIMLYEDEALMIAGALAGLAPDKADRFRKAITKCGSDHERLRLSQEFLQLCHQNDVDPEIAADLWVQMAKFNAYSFCRAHAASYGQLAWTNAYMKAHYPIEFWIGALNNNEGMYDKWVYVEEAKRGGIPVQLPCVHRSEDEFAIDEDTIRIGLNQVRGLSRPARESIFRNRPFRNLFAFISQTRTNQSEVASLIRCGALDCLGLPRPQLLFDLLMSFDTASKSRIPDTLFPLPEAPPSRLRLQNETEATRQQNEWRILAMSAGPHPIARIRPFLQRYGFTTSAIIRQLPKESIRLCGLPTASRTIRAKGGGRMCFMTMGDEDGLFEVTIPPDIYQVCEQELAANSNTVLWVEGQAKSQYDAFSVKADQISTVQSIRERLGGSNQ